MYGFHDRVLWVDLNRRTVDVRPLDPQDVNDFMGGSGLGAAILARLVTPQTEPLSPENPLIFMTGPFTNTPVPAGSRYGVVALSPYTGLFGEANVGGAFGWQLKRSGHDGIVVTGASDTPVYLVIGKAGYELRDADDLWGKDIFEADEALKEQYGKTIETALIGQAGERLVPMAAIGHGGRHTRLAGRCGLGAVMGAKKLKGIVVEADTQETPVADLDGLKASINKYVPQIRERLKIFGQNGTPGAPANFDLIGNLPVRNWRDGRCPDVIKTINAQVYQETIQTKRTGCKRCPISCARLVQVKDGPYAIEAPTEGPEYETLGGFGTQMLNGDLDSIAKLNELCNRLGIDTISASQVIAFATECFEKGLLTTDDTDGFELGFSKPEVLVALVEKIALGTDGIGKLLGQGSRKAARAIGKGAEEYAVEIKGLELPMHDPRFSWGQALGQATSNRGACHLASIAHPFEMISTLPELGYAEPHPQRQREGKAQFVIHMQNLMNITDAFSICKFVLFGNATQLTPLVEWYNLATGRSLDVDGFMACGDRMFTLKRMINNARGVTRKDDTIPLRMQTLKKTSDKFSLDVPPINQMISDFYEIRGWTEEGRPSAATIASLGLGDWKQQPATQLP